MKDTGEILNYIMRTKGKEPLVNSLDELRPLEKEPVKQALKKLGVMLTELSYKTPDSKHVEIEFQ